MVTSKQKTPGNINDNQSPVEAVVTILVCANLGSFMGYKMINPDLISVFIGAFIGALIGQSILLIKRTVKRRRHNRESSEIKANKETLPITIPVKRAGVLLQSKWTLVIKEDSLEFLSDKPKKKDETVKILRSDASNVIRIERQFMGRSVFVDIDGKTVLFIVSKYCEDRLRWWIHHDWGIDH